MAFDTTKEEEQEVLRVGTQKRASTLAGLGLIIALLGLATGVAGALPDPIEDYDNYPTRPAGCDIEFANDMVDNVLYSEGGTENANMRELPIQQGDTVVMTFDGFNDPACAALGISLSVKISQNQKFVSTDNQWLAAYTYCGPEGPTCDEVGNTLSLTLPGAGVMPCFQVDASVDRPLSVIGPAGGYYNFGNEPLRNLLSAKNGGATDCTNYNPCETNPGPIAGTDVLNPEGWLGCEPAPPPPPCEFDANLPADSPDCFERCEFDTSLPADSPDCFEPCAFDGSIAADSPDCFEPCEFDGSIPADSNDCAPPPKPPEPCEFDASLTVDDPDCKAPPEPCSLDASLAADSDECQPCEFDSTIIAGDASCQAPPPKPPAPCATNASIAADSPDCGAVTVKCPAGQVLNTTTGVCGIQVSQQQQQLPATGPGQVSTSTVFSLLLIAVGSTMAFAFRRPKGAHYAS